MTSHSRKAKSIPSTFLCSGCNASHSFSLTAASALIMADCLLRARHCFYHSIVAELIQGPEDARSLKLKDDGWLESLGKARVTLQQH